MISVILCTYNRARLLRRALRSLRRQSFADFEVIIVDDASTDDTLPMVRQALSAFAQPTQILALPVNGGQPKARNAGLRAARGEWITFLDSDDVYARAHLQLRAEAIRQNPTVDLWFSPATIHGDPWVIDRFQPGQTVHLRECRIGGTFVFRRTKALALGGFPEIPYGDDSAFFARAEAAGWIIKEHPAPTYHYDRTTPDALTKTGGSTAGGGTSAPGK